MFSPTFLFIFFLFLTAIVIIILLFSSDRLSPIPYFPSNKRDLPLILGALQLSNNQIVVDLGAGNGWVIFEAAKSALKHRLATKFVAVEINPILIYILHIRRLLNPNRSNIRILRADIFTLDYKQFTSKNMQPTFYLYISPWLLEKVYKKIKSALKARIVSYMYPLPQVKPSKNVTGVHPVFVYQRSS